MNDVTHIPAFNPNPHILDNAALTIGFKELRLGDTVVNWQQSLFSGGLMSAIAQQCSREAASELYNLRSGLFSEEDLVEDKCPPLPSAFNEDYSLKEEYAASRSPAQVANLEQRYALYTGICQIAIDLDKAWKDFFVNSPGRRDSAPQYGLRPNPRYVEGRFSESRYEGILAFEDAVAHYYSINTRLQALKNRYAARADQLKRMNELAELPADQRVTAMKF